jgi:hypothetical protein
VDELKLPPVYNFLFSDKAVRQKVCPFYAQERVCIRSLVISSRSKTTMVEARELGSLFVRIYRIPSKGLQVMEKPSGG